MKRNHLVIHIRWLSQSRIGSLISRMGVFSIGLALFLGWCLWKQGLFYDQAMLVPALLSICVGLYLTLYRRGSSLAIDKKVLPLASITWIILLFYWLTLGFQPASVHATWMQLIRWSSYAAWCFILIKRVQIQETSKSQWRTGLNLEGALVFSGMLLSLGSLATLYHWLPLEGSVMMSDNEKLSSWGFRLGGLLQYPNVLGAAAGAFVVFHLFRLGNRHASLYSIGCIVIHITVLLLTESRAAWLATGAAVIIGFLGSSKSRSLYIKWGAWSFIWAFGASVFTARLWLDYSVWTFVPLLFAVGAAALLPYASSKASGRAVWGVRTGMLALAGGIALLGIYEMPSDAIHRMTGNYDTGSARLLFYKDALRLWQESPWLGRGGDTWRQLFASIQQEPYVGKEVHSIVFDLLLDIGWIGTAIAVLLACWAMVLAIRSDLAAGLAAAVMGVHSLVDFDMAYGWYVYIWLAWLVLAIVPGQGASATNRSLLLERRGLKRTAQGLAVLPLFGAIVIGLSLLSAQALYHIDAKTLAVQASAEGFAAAPCRDDGSCRLLRASLALAPADTALRIAVAHRLPPEEAYALLQQGVRYEQRGKTLHRELALAAERAVEPLQAASYWQAAVQDDRFDRQLRTEAIVHLAQLADAAAEAKRPIAAELAKAALQQFEAYEADVRLVANLRANDKRFAMTPAASQAAMAAKLLLYTLE
ncbi:O-antigen ligase family protein [Paenibacillus sp. 1001270B_150601_E10]|uniref:O-antigen ligase family protein n=1 Tax=Paenibacillus sp. 1001270B_150601_E10 TaxID=2787079 RepID=UPI0018A04809|nr:O-antigen ligase family protein [Paenibacillus sp. 1001270B_150601_E10]